MDTRISTQSNSILIHETNLTFKKDKSIIIFYIRNDFSSAIIGCCLGKWYFYFLYVTCHVQWNTIKENEWYLCKYYANRFLISTFFTFLWIILILLTKHCKYILIISCTNGCVFFTAKSAHSARKLTSKCYCHAVNIVCPNCNIFFYIFNRYNIMYFWRIHAIIHT